MKQQVYAKTLVWLKTNPSLDELCSRYPDDWAAVRQDISTIVERGVAEELKVYLERVSNHAALARRSSVNRQAALSKFVRSRMAHESVRKLCLDMLGTDAGVTKGKLRFNLLNGYICLLYTSPSPRD